jgi:hypothetical protein
MRFLVNGEIVELGSSGVRTRKALDRIEDEGSEIGILDGLPAGPRLRGGERNYLEIVCARFQPTSGVMAVSCRGPPEYAVRQPSPVLKHSRASGRTNLSD